MAARRRSTSRAPADGSARLVLTADEVASMLTVPVDTIKNLHRTGQLRGVLIGKHLRWRRSDVLAFVEALKPTTG